MQRARPRRQVQRKTSRRAPARYQMPQKRAPASQPHGNSLIFACIGIHSKQHQRLHAVFVPSFSGNREALGMHSMAAAGSPRIGTGICTVGQFHMTMCLTQLLYGLSSTDAWSMPNTDDSGRIRRAEFANPMQTRCSSEALQDNISFLSIHHHRYHHVVLSPEAWRDSGSSLTPAAPRAAAVQGMGGKELRLSTTSDTCGGQGFAT
eukprot:1150689-Pelagomonas_calceolata.AAC.8